MVYLTLRLEVSLSDQYVTCGGCGYKNCEMHIVLFRLVLIILTMSTEDTTLRSRMGS